MATNKLGKQTFIFKGKPLITSVFSVVGPKEGQGPMSNYFDLVLDDDMFGEESFEKAEAKILQHAIKSSIQKANVPIDLAISGDLLNQIISSSFALKDLSIPFLGIYGACSTMTESLLLSSLVADGGYVDHVVASASSHFSTAERQFRLPLEHGNQRPPSAQWTVTAAGAVVVSNREASATTAPVRQNSQGCKPLPCVTHGTVGKIVDLGVKDPNLMGAAMAPAAVDTISTHLQDLNRSPSDYDLILTGDLGSMGKNIALDLWSKQGLDMKSVYNDCGTMIFDDTQDTHSGGSGCGCSAAIFTGFVYKKLLTGELSRILLASTGALLSTTSTQQGDSIPSIAHAVTIEL